MDPILEYLEYSENNEMILMMVGENRLDCGGWGKEKIKNRMR